MKFVLHNRYPVESLPVDLRPDLPEGTHVRVVIEPAMSDDEVRAELELEIQKGLRSLDEGRSFSAEDVLARIEARFASRAAAAE